MRQTLLPLMFALAACNGETTGTGPGTGTGTDVEGLDDRVDGVEWDAEVPEPWSYNGYEHASCRAGDVLYVAYVDDSGDYPAVKLAKSEDTGMTWGEPSLVSSGEGEARSPDLACNGSQVWAVWEDTRDGELNNTSIYFNESSDGGVTWLYDNDVRIGGDADALANSNGPRIVVNGTAIHVVWFDFMNGASDIVSVSRLGPSTGEGAVEWEPDPTAEPPVLVEDEGQAGEYYSAWPVPSVGPDGMLHVVWIDKRNGESDIFYNQSMVPSEEFGNDRRIDTGDEGGAAASFDPVMAVTDDSQIYIIWSDERAGANRGIYVNHSANNGANWIPSGAFFVEDTSPGEFDSRFPSIAASSTGDVHMTWASGRENGYDIIYRSANNGQPAPGEVVLNDNENESNQIYPSVVTRGETVAVAWEDYRNDVVYNDIMYAVKPDVDGWLEGNFKLDSTNNGTAYAVEAQPHLMDFYDQEQGVDTYKLVTVFRDGRTGFDSIYASSVELGNSVVTYGDLEEE